jgi:uncharacterized protein (DUF305 family)
MTSLKLLASAGVLAAVALAGCSSNTDSGMPGMGSTPASSSSTSSAPTTGTPTVGTSTAGTPAAGPHNDVDVMFASGMIPHHTQAIQMSDMLLAKQGIDAKVTDLATRIKGEQTPEITQMSGWLAGWGQNPSPSSSMGGMGGMDHGGGMMSQADMDALGKATGQDAAKQYLTGMIAHHRGAVMMAQTELAQGQNPEAKKLAQNIITAQQAEITEMTKLLSQ